MAARNVPEYDRERVVNVNHNHIHEQPTDVIVHDDVVAAEPRERVLVERPAMAERPVVVEQPAVIHQSAYAESDVDVREDVSYDNVLARRAMLDRVSSVIWFVVGVLEAAIALRVVFLLLKANETSPFVDFIYGFTEPLVRPFQGMFNDPAADGAVLDTAGLVAMIVFALVAWALVRLVWLLFDRPETGVSRSVRHSRVDHI